MPIGLVFTGLLILLTAIPGIALAERIRLAVYVTELERDGPGLLLRDILRDDPQVAAVASVIARADADILLLTGVDWDHAGAAVHALSERLNAGGAVFPYSYAPRPNSGLPSGHDLDGDGRNHRARDAHGYGLFTGQGGLVLLSKYPIDQPGAFDLSDLLWQDLPGATMPMIDGAPFPSAEAQAVRRLSSTGHWVVPVTLQDGSILRMLAFGAGPPVFDGEEDANGLRNADEIRLWQVLMDGDLSGRVTPPTSGFVILGNANLDPNDGEGRHQAIRDLLTDPRLQDPKPRSAGAMRMPTAGQRGDPALDTVDWWEENGGPGNLRVAYVLPAAGLRVLDAGVLWSDPQVAREASEMESIASRHRLVWVDIAVPSVTQPIAAR